MWRSFGQGAGRPMGGGGGGGGGGMMKTVQRAVRSGTGGRGSSQEPFYHSTTRTNITDSSISTPNYKPSSSDNNNNNNSNALSFSSNDHPPPFSSVNRPPWATNSAPPPTGAEEYDDFVFCTVPSMDEVHHAVSSLQHSHESGWEFDWIEPSRSMFNSHGSESVYDAFHLLQTEPSVKRMVFSLSSDKSLWDAVMNNEAVRELRDSVYEANKSISGELSDTESSDDDSIPVSHVLHWILTNTKAKVIEIVENITEMVNKLFQSPSNKKKDKEESKTTEPFEKKLRSSFMLTIMVLLIVVVSRTTRS